VKKLALILLMSTALIAPSAAEAANVSVQVDINSYSGPNTYLAVYLVDGNGNYHSTIWVAGSRLRYLGHLRGWARGFTAAGENSVSGISGASVGGGRTLTVSTTLNDALINAGYKVVVDTAVEGWGEYTGDASVPLNTGGGSASGQGFVNRLTVSM
jgi:hypothetical protein